MGTFCTTTSLSKFMIGTRFTSTAMNTLASASITWSENKIKSRLSKRYDMASSTFQTSSSIPPVLTDICEQMAAGWIFFNSSRGGKESRERGKELMDFADECVSRIAEYQENLLGTAGSTISESGSPSFEAISSTDTYTPTFAEDSALNWAADSTKLDDIENDRD